MKRMLLIPLIAMAMVVGVSSCAGQRSVSGAIRQYFPDQYSKAVAVATCESSLNPQAISPGGGNWGLFQINTVHRPMVERLGYSWSQILDPYINSRVARIIYNDAGGWGPWACG